MPTFTSEPVKKMQSVKTKNSDYTLLYVLVMIAIVVTILLIVRW